MLLMWSYITARAIKASYYGGNPCGCCVFLFFDLPGPIFFFLTYTRGACFSKCQKAIWTEAKKKKALQFYILLRIQCMHVWFYIPVHRII